MECTGTGTGVLHLHEEEEDGYDMDKVTEETEDVESHLGFSRLLQEPKGW